MKYLFLKLQRKGSIQPNHISSLNAANVVACDCNFLWWRRQCEVHDRPSVEPLGPRRGFDFTVQQIHHIGPKTMNWIVITLDAAAIAVAGDSIADNAVNSD